MISQQQLAAARTRAQEYFDRAGIVLTPTEAENMEVSDFGLGKLESIGLELVVYINTDRVCAKEIVLFPKQTCPEHRHPPVGTEAGKEETFRCRWGEVYLYVQGDPTLWPRGIPPQGHEQFFTVWHEVLLRPGDQYTLLPDTLHWFQAGEVGAVLSEFSTRSTDEADVFTDPGIVRKTLITEAGPSDIQAVSNP